MALKLKARFAKLAWPKYALFTFFVIIFSPSAVKAQQITTGDYRSVANGSLSTPGIWEKYDGANWLATTTTPASEPAASVLVRNVITSSGTAVQAKVLVQPGSEFVVSEAFTVTAGIEVAQTGILQINHNLTVAASANFSVATGGKVVVNYPVANPAATLWAGMEQFNPGSDFVVRNWVGNSVFVPNNNAITPTTNAGYSALFGNLSFDLATENNFTILGSGANQNLAHGNLEFASALPATTLNLASAGSFSSGIKGNLSIKAGYKGIVNLLSGGAQSFVVSGNYDQQSGTVNFATSSTAGSVAANRVFGQFTITGGTANLHAGSGTASTLYLHDNATIVAPGNLVNTNALGAAGAASAVSLNFAGATTQLVSIEPELTNIPVRINNGATVQLARNLIIDGSAMFSIVQTGATLDFNGFTYAGTSTFRQDAGATLRITSPEGISETGPTGNVQSSNRGFNSAGIYHYTATVPQITGTGLNPASGAKVIIIDNPTTVTLTRTVNISNSSAAGVDIRRGTFGGTADAYVAMPVTNSIFLKMAENTVYQFAVLTSALGANQVLPQANGTYMLHQTSTIALIGEGAQRFRGATKVFGNVSFGGSGVKTLSGNLANIEGTLTIQDAAVVDAEANSLGKTATKFTMTGGRLRTSRTSGVQPAMGGDYNISGGVVEFYGTTAATSQAIRGGKEYYSIEITATEANTADNNVSLSTGSVLVKGEFRIKYPAVFQVGGGSASVTGDGAFVMEAGTTLKYGNAAGITLQSCGTGSSCGNIRTAVRNFPANASYGFIGTTAMVSGNGLPSSIENLYLQKTGSSPNAALTQPVAVTGNTILTAGVLNLNGAKLTIAGELFTGPAASLQGSNSSELEISGTGDLTSLYFTTGYQLLKRLTLNRAGNAVVPLGTPLTITTEVVFANGKLNTDTGTELTFADNATYSGLAASSESAPSYVSGPVKKVGNDAFGFPIGNDEFFAPLQISAPGNVSDSFTAAYYYANPQSKFTTAAEPELGAVSENEYWSLEQTGTSKVNVALGWNATRSGEFASPEHMRVAYLDQAAEPNLWRIAGNPDAEATSEPYTVSANEVSNFGYFTLSAPVMQLTQNPLPVSLVSFTATLTNNKVELKWVTAWEQNSAYFIIERSLTGKEYEPISQMPAAGNSTYTKRYLFSEAAPEASVVYYRLRQVDTDGAFVYLGPVQVKNENALVATSELYPNPTSNAAVVRVVSPEASTATIKLYTISGEMIWQTTQPVMKGENILPLPVQSLVAGIYFVRIHNGATTETLRLIRQ